MHKGNLRTNFQSEKKPEKEREIFFFKLACAVNYVHVVWQYISQRLSEHIEKQYVEQRERERERAREVREREREFLI